jgi:hypothetical protein
MEKLIDKVINDSVVGSSLYSHRGSTWLIFPDKKEWIISLFDENGYLFYNHDFFTNLFRYLGLELGDNNFHVRRWVENNLGLKVGNHFHPDFLHDEYDWRGDFDMIDMVINEGVKL